MCSWLATPAVFIGHARAARFFPCTVFYCFFSLWGIRDVAHVYTRPFYVYLRLLHYCTECLLSTLRSGHGVPPGRLATTPPRIPGSVAHQREHLGHGTDMSEGKNRCRGPARCQGYPVATAPGRRGIEQHGQAEGAVPARRRRRGGLQGAKEGALRLQATGRQGGVVPLYESARLD